MEKIIKSWYADLIGAQGLNLNTAQEYKRHLDSVLEDLSVILGCKKSEVPLEVSRPDLSAALAAWRFRPDSRYKDQEEAPKERSALSVGRRISALRSFYAWCIEEEMLVKNPADRLKSPPVPVKKPLALPVDAVSTVLQAAKDSRMPQRDSLLVALILSCGLSLEEVSSLEVPDANATYLSVSSRKRTRTVALSPLARNALLEYLPVREKHLSNQKLKSDRLLLAARPRVNGKNPDGTPRLTLEPRKASLLEALGRTFQRAGLKDSHLGSHALRVAFARAALDSGSYSVGALQRQLGHSSLTSLKHWAGSEEGDLALAANTHPFGAL